MNFQVPAILTSISYTNDGGLRLGFHTNELSPEEKITAANFHQKFGYLLFKENSFQEVDIPKETAEDTTKTPSKRLRAVLFVNWQQEGIKEDFEIYYRRQVEKIIEHIKTKLD
jgi:hypothetical protein